MRHLNRQSMVGAGIVVALVVGLVSCERLTLQRSAGGPNQECAWTGRPGNLAEWGHGSDYIYGLLAVPDARDKDICVLWTWQGDSLKETCAYTLPWAGDVIPTVKGVVGLALGRERGTWPYALMDVNDGRVLRQWETPANRWIRLAGGSRSGMFIAIVLDEGGALAGTGAQVGLIDVSKRELGVAAVLEGHGVGTIRTVVVTDDGRYVAVAGWNNGTAMIDAQAKKVLWAERPKHEISTCYAAFASDGKVIYTAGSEGCVYTIETATGKVLAQRWASETGESIYGHRVSSLALSADGRYLTAGTGPEGEVYVWDLNGDGPPRVLQHGHGTIIIVAFSPDSRKVASVGGGVLKVWRLKME